MFGRIFAHHWLPCDLEHGGSRPVPYADVLAGSFVVSSAGGCRLLIIESFFHFLPSPSSNTSLPGSKALRLVSISVVGFSFFLSFFVGGDVLLVKKSLLRFFVGGKLWRQDKLIEVALDLSNTLDKGVTSRFLILSLLPSDFSGCKAFVQVPMMHVFFLLFLLRPC